MRKAFLMLVVVVSVVLASTTVTLAADNWIGTWKQNLSKSTYSPGPAPKSATRKYEAFEGGYKFTQDGIDDQGKPTHIEYSAKFDGKDYPVKGTPNIDAVSLKRIDDHTWEGVQKKGGKSTVTNRNVVSRDGKTLTATATGKNVQGQDVHNTLVFDKQ